MSAASAAPANGPGARKFYIEIDLRLLTGSGHRRAFSHRTAVTLCSQLPKRLMRRKPKGLATHLPSDCLDVVPPSLHVQRDIEHYQFRLRLHFRSWRH